MVSPPEVSTMARRQTLKPPRQPGARDLKATSGPQGVRPEADDPPIPSPPLDPSPSKSSRNSPGRGLTLRIEKDMAVTPHSIQSAPVRTIRRLPSVPLPCPGPTTALPSSSTPFSTAAQFSEMPLSPRARRPLPCPPPPAKDIPQIHVTAEVSPPTTHGAVVRRKPLPTPQQKIEPIPSEPPLAAVVAPQTNTQTVAALPSIPRPPSPSVAIPRADKKRHEAPTTPKKASTLRGKVDTTTRDECDAVLLHKRLVLERKARLSLDSDNTSEDEFDNEAFSEPMFVKHARPMETKRDSTISDKELHVDYAWVLSNRMLYQQNSSDGRSLATSKWMRETKGKRYTEQDFDNVLKVLRTL